MLFTKGGLECQFMVPRSGWSSENCFSQYTLQTSSSVNINLEGCLKTADSRPTPESESLGWGLEICILTNSQAVLRHWPHDLCCITHSEDLHALGARSFEMERYSDPLIYPRASQLFLGKGPISCLQNSSVPGLKWTCRLLLFPGTPLAELNCPHNFASVDDSAFSVAPLVWVSPLWLSTSLWMLSENLLCSRQPSTSEAMVLFWGRVWDAI